MISELFLRIFNHLLPNARAWRLTVDSTLRNLFAGLTSAGADVKLYFDLLLYDFLPSTTRELDAWEEQFGLQNYGLTEAQRRDRLDNTWKSTGGQDPYYIQATLQARGFDVYVHEWWVPGTEPPPGDHSAATPRNPLLYLRDSGSEPIYLTECGEPLAQCGESIMGAGDTLSPPGYVLVNKVYEALAAFFECGEPLAQAGETLAECGEVLYWYSSVLKTYTVPSDPATWPYFLYIGGSTFGTMAQIDPKRRDELEDLCLQICPTQLWLGMLIDYSVASIGTTSYVVTDAGNNIVTDAGNLVIYTI